MDKNNLSELLKLDSTIVSELEFPKIGIIYIIYSDKQIKKDMDHYLSFLPTNITIDGKDNHNQRVSTVD